METTLTFNQFLEEYPDEIKDKTLRGFFLLNLNNRQNVFDHLAKTFSSYSEKWTAQLISGKDSDFYIISMKSIEEGEEHYFFIKELVANSKYFVFTYADHPVCEQFNRLLYSGKDLWKPWLGSRFLENFNQFMKNYFPTSNAKLIEFSTEYRDVESKKKKGSSRSWIVRSKEDLLKVRKFQYESFGELSYIKRGKWEISNNGSAPTSLSLSDRGEFALYRGDIYEFLDVGKGILDYSDHLKELLASKLNFSRKIETVHNQTLQTVSFESLKVIDLNMSSAFFENWFDNLMKLQDIGYLSEYKIMVFEKAREDAHFITEIVDIETGNKVYISSDKRRISIAPGLDSAPEPETISKILSMLQARVDPSITLGEDYGQIHASA